MIKIQPEFWSAIFIWAVIIGLLTAGVLAEKKIRRKYLYVALLWVTAIAILRAPIYKMRKCGTKQTVYDFSVLLNDAQIMRQQCRGAYKKDFKPGETLRMKYDAWYERVKRAFEEHCLDFREYHTMLERDAQSNCDLKDLIPCLPKDGCAVLCELLPRERNLGNIIDELRGTK